MPVSLWDERRTTIEAHQILHASGKRMKNQKKRGRGSGHTDFEGYLARKRLAEADTFRCVHGRVPHRGRRGCAVQAFCAAKTLAQGGFISPAQVKMRGPRKIHDFVGRTRWRPR